MQQAEIIAWATEKMQTADESPLEPGYRYYHGLRVAKLSLQLAEEMQLAVDRDILYIGALLHDVGKAGYKGPGHGPRGAELVRNEIPHFFTSDELQKVTQIIANHYNRPKGKYMRGKPDPGFPDEVLVVQDADILDHFGINGYWLSLHWAAKDGRTQQDVINRHHNEDAPWREEADAGMNFDLSKSELAYRLGRMNSLYIEWEREERGELTHLG